MNETESRRARLWLGVLCGAMAVGCTSPEAYRQTIAERDAQIRVLREERASLKRERQGYLGRIDDLGVALTEANASLNEAQTPTEVAGDPRLAELGITYGVRDGLAVISIPSSITFASGKADLSQDGQGALGEVAAVLKAAHPDGVYRIEGHTDSDPIRKSAFETNRNLSIARAMAVLTHLVEHRGIPDEQCVVVGHGQYAPLVAEETDQAKARNRRVEIVVHGGGR
ncbi:MAG: OmpA family protein [Planctomycetota bacterium]|jgi:chemotaxis protein MotB|nr:OmpA family protein [Planctomycetota bacterium]MDP6990653.1 OmpA family protein [Planctomycetota bacterium]